MWCKLEGVSEVGLPGFSRLVTFGGLCDGFVRLDCLWFGMVDLLWVSGLLDLGFVLWFVGGFWCWALM